MVAAIEVAKVATTAAPAMAEVSTVAATAASTVARAVETARTILPETVKGGAKTAELGAEVLNVESGALQAASKLDLAVEEGAAAPVKALQEFAAAPVANLESQTAAVSVEDAKLALLKQEEVFRAVQPQMTEWDNLNPPGNDIDGWIDRRAKAERQFTVNEGVNRDLTEWKGKEENRMPDKDKDPEDYAKWEKRLATQASESRQANETSYDQLLREREQKRQGMSKAEFMRRYEQMLQLRIRADQVKMNMQNLRASPYYNDTLKAALGHSEAALNALQAEITNISADLHLDAVVSGDKWKLLLPALMTAGLVAAPVAASANEV